MTRSTAAASARFRQRKLSTRQTLQILHEDQLDSVDEAQNVPIQKVETGVDKAEEIEHHLQAVISASHAAAVDGHVAQVYIPTPDTSVSLIQYDRLYPRVFAQPATYIRFSSTVEDCSGCQHNLVEEDDVYLKSMNEKRHASTQCSEDQFEEIMNFFEETAQSKQPFASVDNTPVVDWMEVEEAFDESFNGGTKSFARDIFDHWKARRLKNGNKSLTPILKFETAADVDDGDPYVCFRRREVRQVRKTRGRDAQSAEKLKKLRRELEEARHLVALVQQREITKRDQLAVDRQLFEQRITLRQLKRNLPEQYKDGDDDILIHQKPQKKKPLEIATSQRTPATRLRIPLRPDSPSHGEAFLVQLQDVLAEKENEIEREINMKIAQHEKWNTGYVDMTKAPLLALPVKDLGSNFRTAVTEYLPTPPDSDGSPGHINDLVAAPDPLSSKSEDLDIRYASPTYDGPYRSQPSYRRRVGRGGRLLVDRRGMRLESIEGLNPNIVDRYKYDRDDDDNDEVPSYTIDPYDTSSMRYRAAISTNQQPHHIQAQAARRVQLEGSASGAQGSGNAHGSPVVPKAPSSD